VPDHAHYSISVRGVVYPFDVNGFLDIKMLALEDSWKEGDSRANCWPPRSARNVQIERRHPGFANRHLGGYMVSKAPT